jgi:hypothetical protein
MYRPHNIKTINRLRLLTHIPLLLFSVFSGGLTGSYLDLHSCFRMIFAQEMLR